MTHVLYYPSADDVNAGAMTIYAWSPEDHWAGANFETPNILGQNRISEEIFTASNRQPAQREVSPALAVIARLYWLCTSIVHASNVSQKVRKLLAKFINFTWHYAFRTCTV